MSRNQPLRLGKAARARPHRQPLPTEPCLVWWDEWKANVQVYRDAGGLWVCPPHGIPVRISEAIAGDFYPPKGAVRL